MTAKESSSNRRRIGREYEDLAARFLESQGFAILERNYSTRHGEIDLVARDGETLVFVEVRMRRRSGLVSPLETVNREKQRRLGLVAQAYLVEREITDRDCRFDVIGVLDAPGQEPVFNHVRHAFVLEPE